MYDLIYADPPWRYSFSKSKSRKIENQYPTMTLNDICEIKVPAKDNAVLYLWTTAPKLLEGLRVMKEWGFTYKSQAVWDKKRVGMGYWFRGEHELLLVGVKGKVSPPEQSDRVSSMFRERRTKHSKKPEGVYEWIERSFPDHVKFEMYCREPRQGWQTWGNEV